MSVTGPALESALPILRSLPPRTWFDCHQSGKVLKLEFQASSRADAEVLRRSLPPATWTKKHDDGLGWWEYEANISGLLVRIYADREGPAACRRIEEEYQVEEDVPVTFEKRTVTKNRVRWECPEVEAEP